MIRVCVVGIPALALIAGMSVQAQQSDSLPGDIAECRKIEEVSARTACYDRIDVPDATSPDSAGRADEAPDEAVAETEEQQSVHKALTDDVGLAAPDDSVKPILVTVIRCEAGNYRNFYFHFDNGQIWKYIGGKKLRYKDCNTTADLVEDGFGFTLQMTGDRAKHRVKRIK